AIMSTRIINIPNSLSMTRLALVPVLLYCANKGLQAPFLYVLAASLSTDYFDGYLARKLNQTTPLGAKLDSWGDFFTYGAMVFGLMWLWPEIYQQESWFLYLAVFFYLIPTVTSLLKFGEFPNYHTWAAKISAVLMAPAYYLLVLYDMSLLFRIVVLFHIWVAIEELIITFMLNRKYYNVPTLFHAREIVRRQKAAIRQRVERHRSRRVGRRKTKLGE
ncbi:MAG: CDP-alcohol phosphatidyltransferase family protein, partial [Porticoccaceae bacterium]|nr:CDP-alcohol phosphatidyltransferase family protein [Porticoccaceae bacterium]